MTTPRYAESAFSNAEPSHYDRLGSVGMPVRKAALPAWTSDPAPESSEYSALTPAHLRNTDEPQGTYDRLEIVRGRTTTADASTPGTYDHLPQRQVLQLTESSYEQVDTDRA